MSVALLDPEGDVWAWAGRHRVPPVAEGDSIGSRATGYYVVLEARRHSTEGRTAVAGVLIWAHPAVPDRSRSVAELFREGTEVGLEVYPPGSAPDSVDVFDYEEPTTAGPRQLFSVRPVPPEQGTAKQRAYGGGSRLATWLILLAMALALARTARPSERFALLGGLLWLAVRAPVGGALHLQSVFSPATFFRSLLGPLSGSAGALALAGSLCTIAGVWLWRRRLPRRWYGMAVGAALLLAAPYLISSLGRGITPPAGGVSVGLWLSWQLAILVSAAALIVPTAALFRGRQPGVHILGPDRRRYGARHRGGGGRGVGLESARGMARLVHLPLDPGPGAGRAAGAALGDDQRDRAGGGELGGAGHLGGRAGRQDPGRRSGTSRGSAWSPTRLPCHCWNGSANRCGPRRPRRRPPREMYAFWRGSALGDQGYPSQLALWSPRGRAARRASARFPRPAAFAALHHGARARSGRVPADRPTGSRVPGVHYVLLARVSPDEVHDGRGRAPVPAGDLRPRRKACSSRGVSNRRSTGSPSRHRRARRTQLPRPRWRREGWVVRNEYPLLLPTGARVVHAAVDLRGPVPLFVRGMLVVLLDAAVLASLWFLAEIAARAGRLRRPRWRSLARSFRIRLAATLGAFFILPAVGFAAWSFTRLAEEVERSRDLLITQTLRDAAITAGGSLRGGRRRGGGAADRVEPAHRRRSGALSGRPTDRNQHAGARGPRRDAALMDPERVQRRSRIERRARGHPGRARFPS